MYTGPAIPLHLPVIGVHWHRHHLHHHPPRWYRPAADAHSEVLLLGNQPAGVQRNRSQRSWYVHTHNLHTKRIVVVRGKKKRTGTRTMTVPFTLLMNPTRELKTLFLTLFILYVTHLYRTIVRLHNT